MWSIVASFFIKLKTTFESDVAATQTHLDVDKKLTDAISWVVKKQSVALN
jgi:hypothetical protein